MEYARSAVLEILLLDGHAVKSALRRTLRAQQRNALKKQTINLMTESKKCGITIGQYVLIERKTENASGVASHCLPTVCAFAQIAGLRTRGIMNVVKVQYHDLNVRYTVYVIAAEKIR